MNKGKPAYPRSTKVILRGTALLVLIVWELFMGENAQSINGGFSGSIRYADK
jgi:hypothetical protein